MKILLIDIVRDLADIATYTPPYSGDGSLLNPSDELATVLGLAGRLRTRVNALLDLVHAAPGETLTGWTDAHRQFFREWLRKTFPNEAGAATIALGDAWMDGLRVGASVGVVRAGPDASVQPHAAASPRAIELAGVADVRDARSGEWQTCADCHESVDGYPVGKYPYSETLRCELGAGCVNCGGIGAVWDRNVDAGKASTASGPIATRRTPSVGVRLRRCRHCNPRRRGSAWPAARSAARQARHRLRPRVHESPAGRRSVSDSAPRTCDRVGRHTGRRCPASTQSSQGRLSGPRRIRSHPPVATHIARRDRRSERSRNTAARSMHR
ncbi:hypothetical protein LFL96_36955 (plasmid) [Paraburkholderia sp. D15]|uniref:hypothetical protein n=1 Tax=Paraburkholderia sp. D15 TaxID=2880218 RepID=UPI00247A9461|nr:hypothetical protein [Paraburkholderia sp. D15]WGS55069.1 hypothetical protein LFL96_36955 [Paraburkholderia sp. D15]